MKRTYYIIAMSFLGMFYSCNSFLDVVPDNVATINNAFANKYNAEKYLFTCYSFLPRFASWDENPAIGGGDDVWTPEVSRNVNKNPIVFAKGFQNVTDPIFDYWRGSRGGQPLYEGIRDCNIFLENISKVRDLDLYQAKQWSAEVIFLKAYYHYYLIRMYGPISIVDQNIPVSAETSVIKVTREPLDTCFAYVVRMLDKAATDLPDIVANPLSEQGRITKPIALAVKAEVLMTAASPLFNGNQIQYSLKNKDGKALFNSVYDVKKWEIAAQACKEAIYLADSVNVSLYQKSDFIVTYPMNDTTKFIAALRSVVTERWNKELIWGSTDNTDFLQSMSSPIWYPYFMNFTWSFHAPTLKIVEEFYSKNGVPINEDKSWNYNIRYKLRTATKKDWMYVEPGEQTAELNFDREMRYYAGIGFDRGAWFGNGSPSKPDEKPWYIHNRRAEFSSIFDVDMYSKTGMYPKKLVNLGSEVSNGQFYTSYNYSFPVIRLADLYLYYAEALNEIKSTPDASVYEYIDKVRERAGLKGVVESWSLYSSVPIKPTTKTGMRDIIQRERLIELAFEGHRFWDLRRWMLAKKYMNNPLQGWNVMVPEINEYYRVTTLFNQTFTEREYFWPISENEIVKNPNLVQNIGW